MFVDSHCHLHLLDPTLGAKLDEAVVAAKNKQIETLLCVATHLNQHRDLLYLADQYDVIDISVGLHPNETISKEPVLADYETLMGHKKIVAIGETGLDYYRLEEGEDAKTQQHNRFCVQIQLARQMSKPLIIHTRSAPEDTVSTLKQEGAEQVGGVIHCFTESWQMAKACLDLGFYISFSGIVTFKNAEELRQVVKKVPLEYLLIETDTPYLAPVPYRGKTNQPAYVSFVAETIAELKQVAIEEVAAQTTENYYRLFHKFK